MNDTTTIRALAAQAALIMEGTSDAVRFLESANDALRIIESYATGTLDIKTDVYGCSWFCTKAVEPNTNAATAEEQPIKEADGNDSRLRALLKTHGNSAGALSMLIGSGVITPNEARVAAGLPPLVSQP